MELNTHRQWIGLDWIGATQTAHIIKLLPLIMLLLERKEIGIEPTRDTIISMRIIVIQLNPDEVLLLTRTSHPPD